MITSLIQKEIQRRVVLQKANDEATISNGIDKCDNLYNDKKDNDDDSIDVIGSKPNANDEGEGLHDGELKANVRR